MEQRQGGVNRPSFNTISCIQILFGWQLRYLNFALPLEPPYLRARIGRLALRAANNMQQHALINLTLPDWCLLLVNINDQILAGTKPSINDRPFELMIYQFESPTKCPGLPVLPLVFSLLPWSLMLNTFLRSHGAGIPK